MRTRGGGRNTSLGYPDSEIKVKESITKLPVGEGAKKKQYKPDYVLYYNQIPKFVIDAKSPKVRPDKYHYQISGYATALNQKFDNNPIQYIAVTNGYKFILYLWDNENPLLEMEFSDFTRNNPKYKKLIKLVSYKSIQQQTTPTSNFRFDKPNLAKLDRIFIKCHNLIWKKEKKKPVEAFHEFVKIFFIKLYSDKKIYEIINDGKTPRTNDYLFSVSYLETLEHANSDPINVLFKKICNEMEQEIISGNKKRIFDKDAIIDIRPSTIKEVVKILEHYDLSSIDEDLNGRMFEQFLNATIRGRDLGQFFTPRNVIAFMVSLADIKVGNNIDESSKVIDACCGSGGFLVETMAHMWSKIKTRTGMTPTEQEDLKCKLVGNNIFGIDADRKISRIARMNMYLHGDGSNKTYWLPDSLDKNMTADSTDNESNNEVREFKELVESGFKFDIALTNPPFAMTYKSNEPDEFEKIKEYDMAKGNGGKIMASVDSNVLFLERYYDLLVDGGILITVIDDSVLNGKNDKIFRDWLRKKYIIKAVISLPFNTFKLAGSGVKTSILFLRKKTNSNEKQSDIFMAVANNIGHDDFGRRTSTRNNLTQILDYYKKFKTGETFEPVIVHNEISTEVMTCPMQCFVVKSKDIEERIDAFYYCPDLRNTWNNINNAVKNNKCTLLKLDKSILVKNLSQSEVDKFDEERRIFKYIELGEITKKGEIVNHQENLINELPTRARKLVQENDVIVSNLITSLGNNAIIPKEFDGHLATNGLIVIRCKDFDIIWAVMRHECVLKQMYYVSTTSIQRVVSEKLFAKSILVPIPNNKKSIKKSMAQYIDSRTIISSSLESITKSINGLFT